MQVAMLFTIIFAVLLIGFLLVFGGRAITDMFSIGGQANLQQVLTNLDSTVTTVSVLGEGSVQEFSFSLPGGARICFLEPSDFRKRPEYGWNPDELILSQYLGNQESSAYRATVWFYKNGNDRFGEHFRLPVTTEHSFCRSIAQLLLENQGTQVFVRLVN